MHPFKPPLLGVVIDFFRPDSQGNRLPWLQRSTVCRARHQEIVYLNRNKAICRGFRHFDGRHCTVQKIGFANEIRHKTVLWMFVNLARRPHLLYHAQIHHRDAIRHRQRLFLVMRDVNESNADFFLDMLEFQLHGLAQFEIQRAQRLIEQ